MIYDAILSILLVIALISLASIIPLFVLSIVYPSVRHFLVMKFGAQTRGTVIASQRCDDSEDICVCGVYRFNDRLQWEHKVKFRFCWHWPSNAEWDKVMQSCGAGAENPVYYVPWLPIIQEIQWNFENQNVDESLLANPEK